jgi:predicted RNA-binding Zn ribbon-like protein
MLATKSIQSLRLDGGIFCLDFVNTVDYRNRETFHDYLADFKSLVAWYEHTKMLTPKLLHTIERLGKDYPQKAAAVFAKSLQLRELLYDIFTAALQRKSPATDVQLQFNAFIAEAFSNLEMGWNRGAGVLHFNAPTPEQLYWWPVKSAAGLLTSDEVKQLKECPACGWLFLDKSKNQSRKWCSMSTCGDIDKVTRNYQKNKKKKQ